MVTQERIPLRDARLELTRYLTAEELAEVASISLPVVTVEAGDLDLDGILMTHRAFGAAVLEGLVMNSMRIGEQAGIQLLGPGDLLVPRSDLLPAWLADFESHSAGLVRLGLFGNELLAAAYRWPRVLQGLYACIGDQIQRLTAQLVICQLPRVDDRVLAMLWLLSESWGHVTPSGIRLPLTVTHETLGALVGAARPTVTLALGKLADDGAIVHQDSGWLLLRPPPRAVTPPPKILPPDVADDAPGRWTIDPEPVDPSIARAELRDAIHRLRARHQLDRQQAREQLEQVRSGRTHMIAVRQRIEETAFRRPAPPSS
ncbi:MAG: Crp/Fnr family transcriptional regulator [Solirubrobacterales bacterium]|nr:Crp/Fnr family transcriptional regulator [Solirubrobacterales bacterium]